MTSKEWKTYKLSDFMEFNPRETLAKGTIAKKIAMENLQPFCRDVCQYEFAPYNGGVKFKNGDTIMARITPCLENGKTSKVNILEDNEIAFGSTEYIVFRKRDNISDENFIYYLVTSPKIREIAIKSMVGSSGRQRVQADVLADLELELPPLETQEKIARVLSSLDDKIELNNKINQNLEQQAQAIFNTYIAKYSSTKYKVKDVILTANTGADAIQKAPIVDYDTGIRCVRVGDLSNNRNFWQWGFTKVTNDVFEQYQLKRDDIIVTRTATLGLNRLITENLNAVYNNGLIRITVDNNKIFPLLLYQHFQTKDFFNYISRIESETSVRPNMKINYLLDYEFSYLKLTEQNELVKILTPLLQTVEINNVENEKLTQLRDTLLPKLMSGEIDVDKVEV